MKKVQSMYCSSNEQTVLKLTKRWRDTILTQEDKEKMKVLI